MYNQKINVRILLLNEETLLWLDHKINFLECSIGNIICTKSVLKYKSNQCHRPYVNCQQQCQSCMCSDGKKVNVL